MKRTKLFCVIMALLVSFSCLLFGCDKSGANNNNSEELDNGGTYEEEKEEIKGSYLFKQGKSDYVILVPENATKSDVLALDELTFFFKESTGYALKAVTEPQMIPASQKYISIGNTEKLRAVGISVADGDYGRSGFKIVTKDENVYICSSGDAYSYGTLYGVYHLLETIVGYKCYAADEIKIEKKTMINLYDFNVKIIPAVDVRSLNFGSVTSDDTYRNRMKLLRRFNTDEWAINGHSTFLIIKPSQYYNDHPNWYSADGSQLCFSNAEMKTEFIKNVKEYILANPQAIYLCIAMEDKNTFCNCDRCKEKIEKYGGVDKGGEAGLEIAFVNDVADECDKWLKENYPERRMQFVTYAYLKTLKPPVVYDSAQKKYVAIHEDVIARENVSVMFCPISQDYFYGIDTPQNGINADYFRGWQAICENSMVYEYSTDFNDYLINFNNFDTIQERVRFYGKQRLSFYFEQTSWGTNTPCFDAMRIYVTSQLLFDPSQSFNVLKNDFFKNYYKNASDAMLEYYDSLRSVYQRLKDDGLVKGTVYYKLLDANYWKLGTLLSFNKIFDKAFAAIESEKGDAVLYEKLWDRINREKLSTTYMLCCLYKTDLSTDDYDQMVKDLEYYGGKYGIIYSREAGSYSALIADLKK